jgi:hypothetical protein
MSSDAQISLRRSIERQITECAIRSLLRVGYSVRSLNGGERVSDASDDAGIVRVREDLLSCDESKLFASRNGISRSVLFVYGNDGWDCIADYSLFLEEALSEAIALGDAFEIDPSRAEA